MPELALLKLGGSVITDKERPFTVRRDVISRLGDEIRQATKRQPDLRLVVGHGSGSFGHTVAHEYRTHEGNVTKDGWTGYAKTALAASRLNRLVTDILFEQGIPVVSIQPSASARCKRGNLEYLDMEPIQHTLEAGLFPIVFGDVSIDLVTQFTIISTEKIFDYITRKLQPTRIVLAGMVDGVFNADPTKNPNARPYQKITVDSWDRIKTELGRSHATDVTGGMLSKVESMLHLVQAQPDLQIYLVSGEIPGRVVSALSDRMPEGGTLICHS